MLFSTKQPTEQHWCLTQYWLEGACQLCTACSTSLLMHQCRLCRVFEEGNPAAVVTSGLMTVSQLVRMSRENYRPLGEANVYGIVRRLLGHRDAQVRARACNLVGNMCRWVGTCGRHACLHAACTWRTASAGEYPAGLPATTSTCYACKGLLCE